MLKNIRVDMVVDYRGKGYYKVVAINGPIITLEGIADVRCQLFKRPGLVEFNIHDHKSWYLTQVTRDDITSLVKTLTKQSSDMQDEIIRLEALAASYL